MLCFCCHVWCTVQVDVPRITYSGPYEPGEAAEAGALRESVRALRERVADRNVAVKAVADRLTALADDLSMWESATCT